MKKENQSTPIEAVEALLQQDPAYQKAERLVSGYYELATRIVNLRTKMNLTQQELAQKAETHQSRVSKIESGDHDIRLSTLIKIAEALESRVVIDLVPIVHMISPNIEPYKWLFHGAQVTDENIQYSERYITEDEFSYTAVAISGAN